MAKVFFSYSHRDEALRDALEVHLAMLKRQGLIEALHDRRIPAGAVLNEAIDAYVEEADVILCLVSPDFIDSNYCYSREMTRALERHRAGDAHVIPVILRHCEWQQTPLSDLRGTPPDNKPVRAWADPDEALNLVASDVRRTLEARSKSRAKSQSRPEAIISPRAAAEIEVRPRSSNLNVPRVITDKDRDDFIDQTFEFVVEFFANSIAELSERHDGVEAKMTRLDATRFTAAAYREGKKASALTVYSGGRGWGHGRSISFNTSDRGETNSSNGSFTLSDRGSELGFTSLFGDATGNRQALDSEGIAEAIWSNFMTPLQR